VGPTGRLPDRNLRAEDRAGFLKDAPGRSRGRIQRANGEPEGPTAKRFTCRRGALKNPSNPLPDRRLETAIAPTRKRHWPVGSTRVGVGESRE
jgi:hypothetical protein